jgi:hypothetical protein
VLRGLFGPETVELMGPTKVHTEELKTLPSTKYYQGYQMKDSQISEDHVAETGKMQNAHRNLVETLKKRNHLRDTGFGGRSTQLTETASAAEETML